MTKKMFFAGYGGQGIMLTGQMVASAAILEGKETTFFPSYGPEMRGGTANCTVIVSDKPISSPLIFESDCVLAMNLPSMLKFEPTLKPGGVLLLNKSLIHQAAKRDDITKYEIAANEMASELGNTVVANMIMLGAFVRTTGIVKEESIIQVIHNVFDQKKAELADLNIKAFNLWRD
ncbi:MAG: 2-oxoacid:acceptor oxidoreductase family protein [Oscillospiraceae bacterium]|jgi:2-oxoglutarate ferredoxin oxidoreductase subunit gamma|nr:2-oxoacid:acceptor oxidoreductase family protein [Oscillospiraceae bacterium]